MDETKKQKIFMRKLMIIPLKVMKIRVFSEKRNIASEENDNETNSKEN